MATKFEDMNPEQKKEAFEKWVSGRTARRGVSTIRRKATQALIKAHQVEYDAIVVKMGGKTAKKD